MSYVSQPDLGGIKMSMGGGTPPAHSCKISMLWNWYTIDSCFIARSWHVRSKGAFAGSCIGVFFLVVAAQWLHRFCKEFDAAIAAKHRNSQLAIQSSDDSIAKFDTPMVPAKRVANPYVHALGHTWLFSKSPNSPTALEHLVRALLFTVEWGLSYLIMLLFMYYNGYIIISCILGALVGKLVFGYGEPVDCNDREDRKCCR